MSDLFPPNLVPTDTTTKPQVLLSGSLAVMSMMAVDSGDAFWEDICIDIFCTWEAAPFARQRLIERCGVICSGVDNSYMQTESNACSKFGDAGDIVQTAISHVESYNAGPKERDNGGGTYGDDDVLEYASDAYYARGTEWGAELTKESDTRNRAGYPLVGLPAGSTGCVFPCDYELHAGSFVQLKVGAEDVDDARRLLDSFDLEICKCSFDGNVFRVPSPVSGFAGHAWVTPSDKR